MPPKLLSIPEAAEALGLAEITVRRAVLAGRIPHHKIGKLYRFTPQDLEAFVEASAVPARAPR